MDGVQIPQATVARLPAYLQVLVATARQGVPTLSSDELGSAAGVNAAQVRKDLSFLGSHGTRGVGYDVETLSREITGALGLQQQRSVVLVGAGNLGRALVRHEGFARRGFRIVGVVDADPSLHDREVAGLRVRPVEQLEQLLASHEVGLAVLAIPGSQAQGMADRLVAAGIRAILSFAAVHLVVPDGVTVRRVDLVSELQILSFYQYLAEQSGDPHDLPDGLAAS